MTKKNDDRQIDVSQRQHKEILSVNSYHLRSSLVSKTELDADRTVRKVRMSFVRPAKIKMAAALDKTPMT